MIDWAELTLFLYIIARMSGFVLFNPILGRRGLPGIFRSGLILCLSMAVLSTGGVRTVQVPATVVELAVRILLELALGFLLGMVINLFFYIPQLAGSQMDTQMGLTMSQVFDPATQAQMSITGAILNAMMMLLFFAANGHHTMLRIMITSGQLVPFGGAALSTEALELMLEIFLQCTLLGIKLMMPVLAAELVGQVGMGVLMKVIPQINVFVINIDLKVMIGLALLLILIAPFSEFLLQAEVLMLERLSQVLTLA